jgi:DNA primase
MQYTPDFLARLTAKADITNIVARYIPIEKKGKNFIALCPFHQDTNPSMSISPDKQIFKCFVCGTGGSAIQFIQQYEKIPFPSAVRKLAEYVGFDDPLLKEEPLSDAQKASLPFYACLADTVEFYQFILASNEGEQARQYLVGRGLKEETLQSFKIGYAGDQGKTLIPYLMKKGHARSTIEKLGMNAGQDGLLDRFVGRIMFPITNANGQVIGFSGRILQEKEGQAKYVNSADSLVFNKSQLLYNYASVKLAAKKFNHVYILEGFMDVIALHQAGFPQSVALMGTSFTSFHTTLLKRLGVECRIALDPDAAGMKAMLKMIAPLQEASVPFRFVYDPTQTKDTDEIILDEGIEGLQAYLNRLVNKMDFTFLYYEQSLNLSSTESKVAFIHDVLPYLIHAPELEQLDYLKRLADKTGYPTKTLQAQLAKLKPKPSHEDVYLKLRPEKLVITRLKRAEKAMLFNMLINPEAVQFYKEHIQSFTDQLYRHLAEFLVASTQEASPQLSDLIATISASNHEQALKLIQTLTDVSEDPSQPKGSAHSFQEWLKTMHEEKKKMRTQKQIEAGRIGKSPQEQAKLIQQFSPTHQEEIHDGQNQNQPTPRGEENNEDE